MRIKKEVKERKQKSYRKSRRERKKREKHRMKTKWNNSIRKEEIMFRKTKKGEKKVKPKKQNYKEKSEEMKTENQFDLFENLPTTPKLLLIYGKAFRKHLLRWRERRAKRYAWISSRLADVSTQNVFFVITRWRKTEWA